MKKKIFFSIYFLLLCNIIFSQNMEIVWQQCIGGSNDDNVHDIINFEGGYLLAGATDSNDGDVSFSHGGWDAWLVKLDSIGNIIWEKTYGGTEGDGWGYIFPTPDGNYYLVGASGSSDGDIGYDPYPGSNDVWIGKIDSLGNLLWEKIIGGNMIDLIHSGTLTNDGGIVIFGYTGSQDGDVSVNYGMYDMWMVKLNSDGDIEWDKSFGTDSFDWGIDIIQTNDGGFLIGGISTNGSGGNLSCESVYNSEAKLVKIDSIGNIEWQQCYGGSEHDVLQAILELEDGYIFSASGWSADGDLTGSGWHGESDIWIVKVDVFGNIIWQKCYGGSRNERTLNMFKTEDDGFVFIGSTQSQNGDITNNHSISEYDNDIWFLKIDSEGELLEEKCFGGIGNEFIYSSVVKKCDNNYIIAALTEYGPSFDVACAPHGGNYDEDFWVFEIKDCSQYPVGNIGAINGPDTVCTVYDSTNMYTIDPVTGAWYYKWYLSPEGAGAININGPEATVNWTSGWEGTANIVVRAMNDCDTTEWTEVQYTEVFTCLGLEELYVGNVKMKVYPNPGRGFVVFEISSSLINTAVISTQGVGHGGGRRNPHTVLDPTGKPQENNSGRKTMEVSHALAQGQAQGLEMTVFIVDVYGQGVAELPVTSEKTVWNTDKVKDGIYFYRVEVEGEVMSGKVMVMK